MATEVENPSKIVEDALLRRLNMVGDWLRYAETKNGLLLTLLLASIAGLHNYGKDVSGDRDIVISIAIWVMLSSVLYLVFSFVPEESVVRRTIWNRRLFGTKPKKSGNLEDYRAFETYDPGQLAREISDLYGVQAEPTKIHLDLAETYRGLPGQCTKGRRIQLHPLPGVRWVGIRSGSCIRPAYLRYPCGGALARTTPTLIEALQHDAAQRFRPVLGKYIEAAAQ